MTPDQLLVLGTAFTAYRRFFEGCIAYRPTAELVRRNRRAEERHADRLVGNVRRQMEPNERHVKAADEKADGEQPEALRPKCLGKRVLAALRNGRAGLWGSGA